jgi:deoxyadenosine/deoxycytidine kinase
MDNFAVTGLPFYRGSVRTNPSKPIVVYFSGPIAAGKSTIVETLAENLKGVSVEYALERVDLWSDVGIFQLYCQDPSRWAIEFQHFVMVTRIQEELAMWERNPNADVYLIERSVFDDYYIFIRTLFANGIVSQAQLTAYKTWWDMWVRLLPYSPTGFVWLQVSLDELMLRVQTRARESEKDSVSRSYQAQLIEAHEAFFDQIGKKTPVLRLSVQHDYRQCPLLRSELCDNFAAWIDQIKS